MLRGVVTTDSVSVEVHFPDLAVTKQPMFGQDSTDVRLDQPFSWVIVVTNTDAVAPAFDVDVDDVLPEGWTYDLGSAQVITPHNGGPAQVDPSCTTNIGSCDDAASLNIETLSWNGLVSGVTEPLASGETITVVFTATPHSAALTSSQAIGESFTGYDGGSGFAHTNTVTVSGDDAGGSPVCCDPDGADRSFLSPTATTTTIPSTSPGPTSKSSRRFRRSRTTPMPSTGPTGSARSSTTP